MKKAQPKIDKGFGFEMINGLYEQIKSTLKTIADKENVLENASVVISDDLTYSSLEEMEIIIKAETSAYQQTLQSIALFKWAIILFESFTGYLAIGLMFHGYNLQEWFIEMAVFIIEWILAFGVSYLFIYSAMKTIRPKKLDTKPNILQYITAFGCILIVPLCNVAFIYRVNVEIDNKEIYIVSLFLSIAGGTVLLLRNLRITEKEQKRMVVLKGYIKNFDERKKYQDKAKNLYLQIFKQNNWYAGFLENFDKLEDNNTLYAPLKQFLKESSEKGFDNWSEEYIERQKGKHLLSRKKISTYSIPE